VKTIMAVVLACCMSAAWAQAPAPAKKEAKKAEDPKVAECLSSNRKTDMEITRIYNAAKKDGKISASEQKKYMDRERKYRAHFAAAKKGGVSLEECQKLGKELANEKQLVEHMAKSDVKANQKKAK
jgi:hypothetical protein